MFIIPGTIKGPLSALDLCQSGFPHKVWGCSWQLWEWGGSGSTGAPEGHFQAVWRAVSFGSRLIWPWVAVITHWVARLPFPAQREDPDSIRAGPRPIDPFNIGVLPSKYTHRIMHSNIWPTAVHAAAAPYINFCLLCGFLWWFCMGIHYKSSCFFLHMGPAVTGNYEIENKNIENWLRKRTRNYKRKTLASIRFYCKKLYWHWNKYWY